MADWTIKLPSSVEVILHGQRSLLHTLGDAADFLIDTMPDHAARTPLWREAARMARLQKMRKPP